ncbi:hypothetical protein SISNIDRAFT_164734 [Sistotremastrum niveocremeum HHB9708]|uniref:F-box domain-containing protein n=1 Tax=Sistotremastrum niveocremeum HHB9708 TaxID=1314777 RepID=A0A164SHD5_9AGAM|nr:hypothetical protein SISNIDRAFT_164734 [Sistotremastrum niveocremeum HHB9708]
MLVCRHWFSVIHSECRFWRFISLAWPETKIEEHLTRSRDTGLYLRLNVDEPHLLPKISMIRPHLPRIQHLAVGGDFHDVLTNTTDPDFPSVDEVIDCLLEILKNPLTRLTDLIFRVFQPVASPKLRLPARLDFPSLSTLNLVGCFFRSSLADSLPNSLRNIVIELTELFSDVHDLLRLIIQCPNLESLIFRWLNLKPRHLIQGDDDETASPPAKPVMTPLQILEPWTLSVDDVNVLMENLTFPHLSQLLLRILVTESPSSAVVPRSLIRGMTETQDLVVDLSHSLIKCLYTRLPETKYVLEFTLPAEIPSLHARRIRALTEIARPFKNLRSLHLHARLHSMSSSPPLGVAELFITEAEWLEHLSISGDIVGPALDFLGTTTDTTPCPHLTSLSIDAIDEDFTRAQPLGSDGAGFGSGIGTGHYMWQHRRNMIESCLKHRMAAGLKLSKLKLDSAWMDGDVKRLKRLVDHLDIVNNWKHT